MSSIVVSVESFEFEWFCGVVVVVVVCDVSIEGKRWGLLHSDLFRVLFRLGLLEKYLISHSSFEHRRRHLSSPRQIQRKNDLVER